MIIDEIDSRLSISVCLASFNGDKYIREQIDSIIPQLRAGDELIICDDGSSDQTLEMIEGYGGAVKIVDVSRVGGVVKNFDRVIRAATCDIIVLSDQDDVWLDGRLDLVRSVFKERKTILLLMNGKIVDRCLIDSGETLFDRNPPRYGFWKNLWKNSFVGCCMAVDRREINVLSPMPKIVPWHDWYIGLYCSLVGDVNFVGEPTILYRRHGGNFSATGEISGYSLFKKIHMRVCIVLSIFVALYRRKRKLTRQGTSRNRP